MEGDLGVYLSPDGSLFETSPRTAVHWRVSTSRQSRFIGPVLTRDRTKLFVLRRRSALVLDARRPEGPGRNRGAVRQADERETDDGGRQSRRHIADAPPSLGLAGNVRVAKVRDSADNRRVTLRASGHVAPALVATLGASACGRVEFRLLDDAGEIDVGDVAADAGMPPGAILWLPMDDTVQSQSTVDVAGGHTVTCAPLAACPAPTTGQHGGGLRFGPTAQDLQTPHMPEFDTSAGYTVAAWVMLEGDGASGGYSCLISKQFGTVDFNSYALCFEDGTRRVLAYSNNSQADGYLYGPSIALNEWHHVAMAWDGTTKFVYVDGVQAGSVPAAIGSDTHLIQFGADINGTGTLYQLRGALDDVVIYGRVLTPAELAWLAQP